MSIYSSTNTDSQKFLDLLEHRSLVLLIQDTRRLLIEKISQRIEVSVITRENCKTDEWRASPREVVSALQASISAFQGL
jgi:hypothetical protein